MDKIFKSGESIYFHPTNWSKIRPHNIHLRVSAISAFFCSLAEIYLFNNQFHAFGCLNRTSRTNSILDLPAFSSFRFLAASALC